MKEKNDKSILNGATVLGLGAFISKLLGAVYRVPLTNLLGSVGLGLYQMVFPVYVLLLDFSGAGVPNAISKLISGMDESIRKLRAKIILKVGLIFLTFLGVLGTAVMSILSYPISKAQGNLQTQLGYIALSPAILFVCLLSCFRGYFQGFLNMRPTAISQIIEQGVKLIIGLGLVKLFLPNLPLAVGGATLAITISEILAFLYLFWLYKKEQKQNGFINLSLDRQTFTHYLKKIIKTTLPITLIGVIIPLSQVIDSFLIVNLLSTYRADATSLYGLFSGAVATIINLPVSMCYGISAVAVPTVSSSKEKIERTKKSIRAMLLTLAFAIPSAVFCYIFAPTITQMLFRRLSDIQKIQTVELLRVCSPTIILLSFLQTTNGILIGHNKLYFPLISLGIGVIIKTVLSVILLKNASLNIFASGISLIACYFIASLINLSMIIYLGASNADKKYKNRQAYHA